MRVLRPQNMGAGSKNLDPLEQPRTMEIAFGYEYRCTHIQEDCRDQGPGFYSQPQLLQSMCHPSKELLKNGEGGCRKGHLGHTKGIAPPHDGSCRGCFEQLLKDIRGSCSDWRSLTCLVTVHILHQTHIEAQAGFFKNYCHLYWPSVGDPC